MEYQLVKRSLSRDLIEAIKCDDVAKVKGIIKAGANVHVKDDGYYKGYPALHVAVSREHSELVRILLENGAHVDHISSCDARIYPLKLACQKKNFNCVSLLLQHKAKVLIEIFELDPQERWPRKIIDLLYQNVSLNETCGYGYTAFHRAVLKGYTRSLDILIKRGIDIDHRTLVQGQTSLLLAASVGNWESIKYLLQHGAATNLKDQYGQTALHLLIQSPVPYLRKEAALEMLLESGCDVNEECNMKRTALFCAQLVVDVRTDDAIRYRHMMETSIVRYIAKLHRKGDYVSKNNYDLIEANNKYKVIYNSCLEELDRMQNEAVYNKVKLYDFLYNTKKLLTHMRNKEIGKEFEIIMQNKEAIYPNYYKYLRKNFSEVLKKRHLLDRADSEINWLTPQINSNSIIKQAILEFLNIKDLEKLVSEYSPDSSPKENLKLVYSYCSKDVTIKSYEVFRY